MQQQFRYTFNQQCVCKVDNNYLFTSQDRRFIHLGWMISLSVAMNGSAFSYFAPSVYSCIASGVDSIEGFTLTTSELPLNRRRIVEKVGSVRVYVKAFISLPCPQVFSKSLEWSSLSLTTVEPPLSSPQPVGTFYWATIWSSNILNSAHLTTITYKYSGSHVFLH